MFIDITAIDGSIRAGQGRYMGRLASWGRADVKNEFMRLRIQCMGDELGRFILYHGQSVMDFLQILNARIILKINSFRRKRGRHSL